MQTPKRPGRPSTIENASDSILKEAARLFAVTGYDGASISQISDALGITKPAIYHYFPSKRAIYDEIILRMLDGLYESVSTKVAALPPGRRQLRQFMLSHAAFLEENFWGFAAMLVGFGGMDDVETKAEAVVIRDRYEALLRRIICDAMAVGELRDVDVVATGRAILSMLNWMARWFRPGGAQSAAEIAETYFTLIVDGIAQHPDANSTAGG